MCMTMLARANRDLGTMSHDAAFFVPGGIPRPPSSARPVARIHCSASRPIARRSRRAVLSLGLLAASSAALAADDIDFATLESGLMVQDLRAGRGASPSDGSVVVLRWTGRLAGRYGWPYQQEDGAETRYTIGRDKMIAGFEEGIRGMREGGKRRMVIPPGLGYVSGRENPRPTAFGDRRRLESTVANSRRIAGPGQVVIDVELLKVRPAR